MKVAITRILMKVGFKVAAAYLGPAFGMAVMLFEFRGNIIINVFIILCSALHQALRWLSNILLYLLTALPTYYGGIST